MDANKATKLDSKAFPQGGFYIMRSGILYMIIDGVPISSETPLGHQHNSKLSFELYAYDKTFLIDPGSYVYTPFLDWRDKFRSTAYHNTIVVDGEEQNRFATWSSLKPDAAVKINKWEVAEGHHFFDGEHSGYKRLKNPIIHRRQIFFNKAQGYWMMKKIYWGGEGIHQLDLCFHFSPLKVELASGFPLVARTKTEGANLVIIPLDAEGVSAEIEECWISYRYGVKEKSPVLKYSKKTRTPTSFCNITYPYQGKLDIREFIEKVGTISTKVEI